ncbi:hypothetical protein F5Y17DRAFT_361588 [Xylariaceae sp. FL0594]|nr:hypothetical protein F5Y17DRAFT_361588 [Xylariaceae sp. FL0594]
METKGLTRGAKRKYEGEHGGSRVKDGFRDEDYFRNLYAVEPDFHRLGTKYAEFGSMLIRNGNLDFTDPAAVMQLTKTLLKEDFGIEIELLPDRLCPPVPNRHNYILWLKELIDSTAPSYSDQYEPERTVKGLDIGTGASLIYPLLGCVQRPRWHFIATDVDQASLASARRNAALNHLVSRIRIVGRAPSDALIPLDELQVSHLDFVMVNPPFYASETELLELAGQKSRPPHSACTGAPVEMVCTGGEVEFVKRMIHESLALRERVQWYTAMLGKQSSLEHLIDVIRGHGVSNFTVTTFTQGTKTRRWALGWTFSSRRPSQRASRASFSSLSSASSAWKRMLPPPTEISMEVAVTGLHRDAIVSVQKLICDTMAAMDLRSWVWEEGRLRGVGLAEGNVWSRAYRRRQSSKMTPAAQEITSPSPPLSLAACPFGFSITIHKQDTEVGSAGPLAVILRWLQGTDDSLFESFLGVIRRCLRSVGAPGGPDLGEIA